MVLDRDDDAWRAARDALTPERNDAEEVSFGTFDPASNTLTLEDAVTFANYRVPIESHDAFRAADVLGRYTSRRPKSV